jgi:hypothetical protein
MRPFLARFSVLVWSGHLPSWADFITTTPVFRFSVHTGLYLGGIDLKMGTTAPRLILLRAHDPEASRSALGELTLVTTTASPK